MTEQEDYDRTGRRQKKSGTMTEQGTDDSGFEKYDYLGQGSKMGFFEFTVTLVVRNALN